MAVFWNWKSLTVRERSALRVHERLQREDLVEHCCITQAFDRLATLQVYLTDTVVLNEVARIELVLRESDQDERDVATMVLEIDVHVLA